MFQQWRTVNLRLFSHGTKTKNNVVPNAALKDAVRTNLDLYNVICDAVVHYTWVRYMGSLLVWEKSQRLYLRAPDRGFHARKGREHQLKISPINQSRAAICDEIVARAYGCYFECNPTKLHQTSARAFITCR